MIFERLTARTIGNTCISITVFRKTNRKINAQNDPTLEEIWSKIVSWAALGRLILRFGSLLDDVENHLLMSLWGAQKTETVVRWVALGTSDTSAYGPAAPEAPRPGAFTKETLISDQSLMTSGKTASGSDVVTQRFVFA